MARLRHKYKTLYPCSNQRIDLHVHSSLSDGFESFQEIINLAHAEGLSAIGIVDHDTLEGMNQLKTANIPEHMSVLAGVEASARNYKNGRTVHILGYMLFPTGTTETEQIINTTRANRLECSFKQINALSKAGYNITCDEVIKTAKSGCIYKQHIMYALTGKPYTSKEYQRLYKQLFKNGGIADMDIDYPDAREVVEAIIHDGGVPILAHPGESIAYNLIPDLVEAGLLGIEKYHPSHKQVDHDKVELMASRYDLIKTGGSDYHGIFGAPQKLGQHVVNPKDRTHRFNALFSLGVME